MPISFSHSSLKDFEGCARRYHEVKVLKRYPFKDTPQTLYGKDLHSAIENYGKSVAAFPEAYIQYKPAVDAILAKRGRKFFEHEMGVTAELHPCDFRAANVWARGIADLVIIDDDALTGRCVDWKSGNDKYPDVGQLELMALLMFARFPHIRRISSALMFLVKGTMFTHKLDREEAPAAWQRYRERVAKLEAAHASGVWSPRQTPLCGWCPVQTCEFNTKRD